MAAGAQNTTRTIPSTPTQIWICVADREPPEWVAERMTTGEIATDGSFDIEAGDGPARVERGQAVFIYDGQAFACTPRQMPQKLAELADGHPAVLELTEKVDAFAEQKARNRGPRDRGGSSAEKPTPTFRPAIGTPPAPQFAPTERLLIDDTYQRSIEGGASQKLITKIAVGWDWRLCLPLLVSRRGGTLYVIDGQHRLEAARLRGDIPHMPVVVFDFDDLRAEADLFVQANRSRRTMSMLDDFHAAIAAGEPKAVAISAVVEAAGLQVGRNMAWQYWKPGEVIFVRSIQRGLNAYGPDVAKRALTTIARAFEGQVLTGGGAIFDAIGALIADSDKSGKPIDPTLLQAVLTDVGIVGWKEAVEGVDGGQERTAVMIKAVRAAYQEAEAQ